MDDEVTESDLVALGERIAKLVAHVSPTAKLHTFSEVCASMARAAGIERATFLSTMGAYFDGAPQPWFWEQEVGKVAKATWSYACPSCGSYDLRKDEKRRTIRCSACAVAGTFEAFLVETESDPDDIPDGPPPGIVSAKPPLLDDIPPDTPNVASGPKDAKGQPPLVWTERFEIRVTTFPDPNSSDIFGTIHLTAFAPTSSSCLFSLRTEFVEEFLDQRIGRKGSLKPSDNAKALLDCLKMPSGEPAVFHGTSGRWVLTRSSGLEYQLRRALHVARLATGAIDVKVTFEKADLKDPRAVDGWVQKGTLG